MNRRAFLQSAALSLLAARTALAASPARQHRNLYILGQFEQTKDNALDTLVQTLANSSFNVFTLAFLGITGKSNNLQLLYNGHAFTALSPRLPKIFRQLRSGSAVPRKILLSIGGWASADSFSLLRSAGISAFVQQLTEQVIAPLGLDGIDLDLEPMQGGLHNWFAAYRDHGTTLAAITNEYKRLHPTHTVTHSPTTPVAAEFYAKASSILNSTRIHPASRAGNHVDGLNVQLYEGGIVGANDSAALAAAFQDSLVMPLLALREKTGIAQPLSFLQPTFEPNAHPAQPEDFCVQTLRAIQSACAPLHAGRLQSVSLWEYKQVLPNLAAWSTAMQNALG